MIEMDNHLYDGRNGKKNQLKIVQDASLVKQYSKHKACILIKNIPSEASSKDILDEFQKFGPILYSLHIAGSDLAFIQYAKKKAAENAREAPVFIYDSKTKVERNVSRAIYLVLQKSKSVAMNGSTQDQNVVTNQPS